MHTTREDWLLAATGELRPVFEVHGLSLPAKIRLACGFTSAGRRGRVIGECWSSSASVDAATEILIAPTLDDASRVLDVLVHELIHAAGVKGHGKAFGAAAAALGLVPAPKWTSTAAGPDWQSLYGPILDSLGPYPHGRLQIAQEKPKQGTRQLKAVCDAGCGYTIRLTAKWASIGMPGCHCGGTFKLV